MNLQTIVVRFIVLFTAIPIHEFAHAVTAYWLGDDTAKRQGRLTINPLKHLDLMGTVMMFLIGVGFAQPVNVDTRNFKRPKLYMAITAIAGPISNLILAFLAAVLGYFSYINYGSTAVLTQMLLIFSQVNCMLIVLNMLPIPPLDGSRILNLFLPNSWSESIAIVESYMMPIVLILFYLRIFDNTLVFLGSNLYSSIFNFVVYIFS